MSQINTSVVASVSQGSSKKHVTLDTPGNIFLTGQAGTGKTYTLNAYINSHDNVLVAASTGTAAVELGGTTAHRLFGIPIPAVGAKPSEIKPAVLRVIGKADSIIVDEISMMRNDAFAYMIKVIRKAERQYNKKIKLIVCGDFSQLPPVVSKSDRALLKHGGFDQSGFAFTTPEWKSMKFKTMELLEIKRQDNEEFIRNLGKIRTGDTSCLDYFAQFTVPEEAVDPEAIRICGTNAEVKRINDDYIESIDSPVFISLMKTQGSVAKDLPCEEILVLKKGMRVMFTVNDCPSDDHPLGQYQNGTFATVLKCETNDVVVETDDGDVIDVFPNTWTMHKYKIDPSGDLIKEPIGTVTQIPLKAAKAITIHKSQGKTFDKVVLSPEIFACGQLYVALSRVRDPKGLQMTGTIEEKHIMIDEQVMKFYANDFTFDIPEKNTPKTPKAKTKAAPKKTTVKKTTVKKAAVKTTTKKPTKKTPITKTSGRRKAK